MYNTLCTTTHLIIVCRCTHFECMHDKLTTTVCSLCSVSSVNERLKGYMQCRPLHTVQATLVSPHAPLGGLRCQNASGPLMYSVPLDIAHWGSVSPQMPGTSGGCLFQCTMSPCIDAYVHERLQSACLSFNLVYLSVCQMAKLLGSLLLCVTVGAQKAV